MIEPGEALRELRAQHWLAGPTTELRAAVRELRAHLAAEEEVHLCARVLRDDLIALESSS